MALVAKELLVSSRRRVISANGDRSEVRRWLVPTNSPDAAERADGIPDPLRGEVHPDFPTLTLRSLTTDPTGQGSTYVEALYSNARGSGSTRTPPNQDLVNKGDWDWGCRFVTVEFPINKLGKMKVQQSAAAGQLTETIEDAWTLHKGKISEKRVRRILKVRVKLRAVSEIAQFDVVAGQAEKVHTIAGRKYLYTPGENAVRRVGDLEWEVVHTWELDAGTVMPKVTADPDKIFIYSPFPSPPGGGQPALLRSPYAVLDVIPPDDPRNLTSGYFRTVELFPYAEDAQGWRSLPGVPNLD